MALDKYIPKAFAEYSDSQVVLNSDRILFNARKDSLFLNANKSIGLASAGTINFDIEKYFIVNSKKNYFGINSVSEEEPAVLGGKLKDFISDILDLFTSLADTLKDLEVSAEGGKLIGANMAGTSIEIRTTQLRSDLNKLFSKITYFE